MNAQQAVWVRWNYHYTPSLLHPHLHFFIILWLVISSFSRSFQDFKSGFPSNMKYLAPFSILVAFVPSIYYTSAASSNMLVQDPSNDNSEECTCYLISGPSESYFQHHRFWDFRSIPADGANDYTLAPPSLNNNTDDLINAPPTSTYLSTSDFVTNWSIQNWTADADTSSPVTRVNSAQNIYLSRNGSTSEAESQNTYLTLRATRLDSFISIAELDSNQKNLLHSSIRARMRIIPSPLLIPTPHPNPTTPPPSPSPSSANPDPVPAGAVAGLFTYHSTHAESDIEILTRDPPTQIRYSNQPDYDPSTDSAITGASTQSTLPSDKKYTDWLDHRIDWFDGLSRWYVDDEIVLEKRMNVPTEPSGLILNLWGDGGEWSGGMEVGAQVVLGVEWIEMVFNISGKVEGPVETGDAAGERGPGGKDPKRGRADPTLGRRNNHHGDDHSCKVACRVDGVTEVGFPEVAFNATSASGSAASLRSSRMPDEADVLFGIVVSLSLWLALS